MHRIAWIIFALGALALLVGPVQFGSGKARPLTPAQEGAVPLGDGPFRWDGIPPSTDGHEVPPGIATRGSWLPAGGFQGGHETGWYQARPRFTVLIAGYPSQPPNRLEVDVSDRGGARRTLRYTGANPGDLWQPWHLSLPDDVVAMRIRATDASDGARGWMGFSQPFSVKSLPEWQAWGLLQLGATTCLALSLLYGPALVWMRRTPRASSDLALAIIIGPLQLVALGLACWALGGLIAPAIIARTGIAGLLAWLGWRNWHTRDAAGPSLSSEARTVIAACALFAGFAVAKANFSSGPEGELYSGLVSRSLAVGGHSDSRVPFHVVQVVANHFAPFAPEAEAYFSLWSFASRGPLAGFIAAPIVLATGATVPRAMPDQPWQPFDREGFAAYRITLIVLASLAGWAVFGVAAALVPPAWALLAASTALLTPFFVHEIYFTWPKLITAALVLAAFRLAYARRPFAAGAMLGLGYLFHPLALLSAPFFALWLLAGHPENPPRWRRIGAVCYFFAGVVLPVIPWQIVAALRPGSGGSQAVFMTYVHLADNQPATWLSWWHTRWQNFANTFLPFYLLTGDPAHESINSVYAPSNAWVRADFLYWNTLPFALGAPTFLLLALSMAAAFRRVAAIAFVTVIGPALLLIGYWGAASTGLMRQCGHVLFLSVIVLGIWALRLRPGILARAALTAFLHPVCFAWRGTEIAIMAFGTTLLNPFPHWRGPFGWNDAASLVIAAACLAAAVILLAKSADRRELEYLATAS